MRLNKQVWLCGIAAAAMMMAGSGVANADPVGFGTWYGFTWSGDVCNSLGVCVPLPTEGIGVAPLADPGDSPWTWSGPALLTVTDMQADVDSFSVWDGGSLVGNTPPAGSSPTGFCSFDPDDCIANNYSHKSFLLGAGDHSLTLFDIDKMGFTGIGAFRLDTASVPEPLSLILLGSGLAGLAIGRRRKA